MNDATRHTADTLIRYAQSLLQHAGLDQDKAADVAAILVEGDLLGHDTHGLALLAGYLGELDKGSMCKTGSYATLQARGAAQTWDGRRLPGAWLVLRAMEAATAMAREHGTGTVVIRRSHHIACLAAYLRRATEQGLLMELICSDPNSATVAPYGGTRALFTPNPLAIGFPTGGEPVLVDVSASLTTNGMTARLHRQGRRLEHAWLLDANGAETDDPSVLFASPPGTLQPLGGMQAGHKGYGLALWVEALTGGLAGHAGPIRRKAGVRASTCRSSTRRPSPAPMRSRARCSTSQTPAATTRRAPMARRCVCPARTGCTNALCSCARASRCTRTSCPRCGPGASATASR